MSMKITFEYTFGDIVYLKTDIEQLPRQVVQVAATQNSTLYELVQGDVTAGWHYSFEISREKDIILTTTN